MDEITEHEIQKEMQRMVGGALTLTEWFLVFSFLDMAIKKDEMFASLEDATALSVVVKRLHDQVFPTKIDNTSDIENILTIKPKKLILPKGPDIIA